MLLIFPPVAKPCEPPAGIAKLAAALKAHHISCTILDANLEGLLYLLQQPRSASDTWTRRAIKNLSANVDALRKADTYQSLDRYTRAVRDLQRVLEVSAKEQGMLIGLADYHHHDLSPVRSEDLLAAADRPDQNPFYPYFKERLAGLLGGHNESQQIIGLSLNYLSQALCTFAMIGYVKKKFPGKKIVLGGGLVSSWMKRPDWKNPFGGLVDHLIAGPGEGPLLDLLGRREVKESYSVPEYEALLMNKYLSPGFVLPYSGSSGCYWNNCSFCPETAEDNPYIPVPVPQAMEDLRSLVAKTKPVLVHLLDNSVSPALLHALADGPLGVPWYGFARLDKDLLDIDFCRALKRSGCIMLKLGLESGDQGVLDRMQKGIDLATASQALKNLRLAGIAAYVYLLFGTPAETLAEARKTLAFVAAHKDAITFLNLAIFNMPVCSLEAGEYETKQFYEGDLSLYTGFKHPRGWDRRQVRKFLDTEFKRHPAVSAILKNDPPIFTSNHAAFFVKP
jgi:Radical SAM superfamily